jgi:hypothetical protein
MLKKRKHSPPAHPIQPNDFRKAEPNSEDDELIQSSKNIEP